MNAVSSWGAATLATLVLAAAADAQATGLDEEGAIDNLRHPPDTRTVEPGELGEVVKRGHGPVHLLLLPGAPFGAGVWSGFMERNAERYTMWAVTEPGYGGTAPPPMPSWDDLGSTPWLDAVQSALARLIETEGMNRPIVVGHHLEGDYHALRLGLERPDLVSGVVVMAGVPGRNVAVTDSTGARRAAGPEERIPALRDQWVPFYRTVDAETWRSGTYSAAALSRDSTLGSRLFEQEISVPIPTQIRYFIELMTTSLPTRLRELEVPLLVIPRSPVASLGEHFDRGTQRILALPEFEGMDAVEGREAYIASRLERFGSETDALTAIYGSNWLEMAEPPPDLYVEAVGPSGVFVYEDRVEDVDRILESWIRRKIERS